MNRSLRGLVLCAVFFVSGCNFGQSSIPANSPVHQIGRYQFIEKTKYDDGTIEYACLDTATGDINYASISVDPKKNNLGSFSCAN